MSMETTRRALIGGAGLAIVAGGAIIATGAKGQTSADSILEAAWQRRVQAYAAYIALPIDDGPVAGLYTPDERNLLEIIDEAENVIRSTVATTPRGVMLQLWCAMYHAITDREDDEALTRGDFATLDRLDSGLDWDARLTLAALRSLQKMGA